MRRYLLYFCFMVFFSATAIAEPTITLKEASSVTSTTATLSATVNSGDWDYVEVSLEYRKINSNNFRLAGSTTTIYNKNTSKTVTTNLTGLEPDTEYQFRVHCTNVKVGGSVYSNIGFFCTTPPHDPYIYLDEVTNLTPNSATLNGRILNEELGNTINWWFEYGTSYDRMTSAQQIGTFTGTGTKSVSAQISNLKEETVYYYRLRCTAELTGKTHTSVTGNFQTPKVVQPTAISLNKSSITMAPGDSETLKVTFTPNNATSSITWSSSNSSIVTVNSSGIITAKAAGTATVTATTSNGKKATCTVTVKNPTVILDKSSLTLAINQKYQLTATINPQTENITLSWTSSNTKVANVDKNGVITALAVGTTTITAQLSNGNKATCMVTVTQGQTAPSAITLQPTSMTISVGQSKEITYTLYPSNASTTITWSSANTSIATVSSSGVVKGINAGTTTITAKTANGLTATCKVTVDSKVMVTSISLNPTSMQCLIGVTEQFTATISPSNATDKSVTWTSSNTKVATVTNTGLVTALSAGSATITCKANDGSGVSKSANVTVSNSSIVLVSSITLNETSAAIKKGDTKQLTATISPSNATNKTVTWTSSNTSVATVNNSGLVTAVSTGTATITCKANDQSGKNATCTITVTAGVPITSISLNTTAATLAKGATKQLTATIYPSNATNKTLIWESSDITVATISNNGFVTAWSAGTAIITCKATDGSGKSATCTITVPGTGTVINVTSISLNYTSATLAKGETKQLTATVSPSNATNKNVTWKSSNTSVATVSSNGLVTAVAAGSATITCIAADGSGKSATCAVTVTSTDVKVTSITLNATSATLTKGETKQLTATVSPSNATNKTVTWTSSNTSVATVNNNGLVTAVAAGTATITCKATDGSGKSATCAITVQNSGSNSGDDYWSETAKNTRTMDQNNIEIGKTVTAKVPFAEQYLPMITECKWSTKGSSNITIIDKGNNSCQIKTIKEGQCYLYNFTKFSDGDSYEIIWPIYVTAGSSTTIPVTSISLNASSASLKQGETKQLTATVSPSNATNKNVTWKSSNTSVATVSSNGLVTAVAAGSATITCTAADGSGKSATCKITVTASDVKVTSITLNATSANLTVNETKQLTATVSPSNATNKNVTWTSSNTSVATVSSTGLVTAVAAGTATITCSASDGSGKSATCKITVQNKLDNMSVMTSSAGYATFYSSETAYTLPSHLSAQVVTNCYDNKLTFNTIADGNSGGVIPKGTAVMLVNDMKSSASFTLVPSTSTTQYTGTNYLHGSDVATTTSASGTNYYYKLTYGDAGSEYSNIFGWYWGASNGAPFFIEGHKAWLALPTSAVKRSAFFVGDVSGINDLIIDEEEGDGLYYDILGRPVKEPNVSGVYIRNGKKVLIMK